MFFLAATAILGSALNFIGQQSAAASQAAAARKNANLKNQQAAELLARQRLNEGIMREKAQRDASQWGASFASSGFDGGIGGMVDIKSQMEENIILSRREAEYKASQLDAGAEIDRTLASDISTSAMYTGAGTIIGMAGKAYGATYKYKKSDSNTKSLPEANDYLPDWMP